MIFSLLLACGTPPTTVETGVEPQDHLVPLEASRLLRRMSLDLRGILPGEDELDAVEENPDHVEALLADYLESPLLEERLVSVFADQMLTRLDRFEVRYYDYYLEPKREFEFNRSVADEPLRLMAHIAVGDRPWTDIVTADHTMANPLLADLWPLDYPEGETGWQESRYTDARPAAGILVTNGLWWRYVTNISNMNRSRAAAISDLLLCQDLLSRPVSFSGSVSISDPEATENAISTIPACISCHSSIEPLASALFGFWTVISYNPLELDTYHAEREHLGETFMGVAPGYFGTPLQGLVDLGPAIANDSRFYSCAARSAAEAFWRREVEISDFEQVETLRLALLEGDLRYKALLDAVMRTPEYRAGGFSETASDEALEKENTFRLLTPDLLTSSLEDLTGFRWEYDGYDQLGNDNPGYRVLAGGIDGYSVTRSQDEPGITWVLTVSRVAQAAASFAVTQELVEGGERRLLLYVDEDSLPGDEDFEAELEQLHWRLHAQRPDEETLESDMALWTEAATLEGPIIAWTRLVSVLLRDPGFLGY